MMLRQRISCCRECKPPIRHQGCHGTCEKYIEERNAYERLKKEIDKKKAADRLIDSYVMDQIGKRR